MTATNWVGKKLNDRYLLEELIGQGGMSSVYKATDPNLQRIVAVKMIHEHLSDNQEFVQRFETEAAAVAQLRHPNIIQVYDFNNDNGIYYMVLEFVPGETLQDRLKRLTAAGSNLPIDEAVKYAVEICEATEYAHKRDMIHRDIKPANIMLNVHGQAILMDFGIAKIIGGQQHTATGAVIGTALYMSPEQIQGEKADARSDVYSTGVTLFEMLSGRPPFEADSAMTLMMMHVNDPVPDLRQLQSDVPPGLAAVVDKSLEKNRAERFQSSEEMAQALRSSLDDAAGVSPVAAPTPEATYVETVGDSDLPTSDATYVEGAAAGAVVAAAASAGGDIVGEQAQQSAPVVEVAPTVPAPPPGDVPPASPTSGTSTSPGSEDAQQKKGINPLLIAGIAGLLIVICLVVGGVFAYNALSGDDETPVAAVVEATDTSEVIEIPTEIEPTETEPPTATPPPTETLAPLYSPTPTLSPTPTIPPGIPYVTINDISIEGSYYVVEYETYEYTEQLPGMHIHFFYDTVPPDEAGVPGNGPWKLYGGPRPFKGYTTNSRPYDATMMCALVANPNHSVQQESGNCYPLPDV